MRKQRVVVKIGSSSLTNDQGEIDNVKFDDHIEAIANLRIEGHEVILVSSGAIAAGFSSLHYPVRPVAIKGRQAAAAVGQSILIKSYIEKLSKYNLTPAQLLLTRNDFSNRECYRNAFQTISELLDRGMLPIINENDTVAIDELTFGDNDMLSALVSGFIHADQLIILTDVNGLYTANPNKNPDAERIDFLNGISEEALMAASSTGSKVGTGGMKSKLEAAQTAISLGVPVFIGFGEGKDKLLQTLAGEGDGTYVTSDKVQSINTSKQWIALHSEAAGQIYVDEGAEDAILYNGRSLLAAGIISVVGSFERGNVVEVYGESGFLGKGEVECSSDAVNSAILDHRRKKQEGEKTQTIEVIHRNQWVEMKTIY